ncbi:UdgX family uracil-DNA binding protein [Pontivivens insulae]|uniref:Type-4 uracil-DNA glycosylase n=1 Tax=Pontivivens insulae TaxID=1639689 RepID=A0A2R8ACK4_9RHOB|nr:UdgX family uracil-DNA binding protein [Pontivivens insulae]RED13751.1 DNA polymerase [Pontivivens insulae]SPF29825.1 hypothetical protein POI8812_02146 [Pontivivens insulae]
MIRVSLGSEVDFAGWREAARALASNAIAPSDVNWQIGEGGLFDTLSDPLPPPRGEIRVPRGFVNLARNAVCHRDPQRFSRLYALLFRLQTKADLLANDVDDEVRWLKKVDKEIRRDLHKMHAFVRFRKLGDRGSREVFAAWFEPYHRIEQRTAQFFVDRFTGMDWAIVTPEARIVWEDGQLSFGPGGTRSEVPEEDVIEEQWKSYFQAIFNPARLMPKAMQAEMPKKYWKNLPEAALIPEMIAGAERRAKDMQVAAPTAPTALSKRIAGRGDGIDDLTSRDGLIRALSTCDRCSLHCHATQAVAGDGPLEAAMMIVGEQPGDQEDLDGRPFVGPAGQLLDQAFARVGIQRDAVYLTNAVKHFKFEVRGKRRIHKSPSVSEIEACRWWLDNERGLVRPRLILALGASAARAVMGHSVRIGTARGQEFVLDDKTLVHVTVHPSYLLRLQDRSQKIEEWKLFLSDLERAKQRVSEAAGRPVA